MKKLKEFWHNNSILFILAFILIACMVAIGVVVLVYFVGDTNGKFGDRLEGIDEHPFSEEVRTDYISKFSELIDAEKLKGVNVSLSQARTIYIVVEFDSSISLDEAKSKCLTSLDYFDENILNYYDVEFFVQSEASENASGYLLSGSHNVNGTGGIVWNNATEFTTEEE